MFRLLENFATWSLKYVRLLQLLLALAAATALVVVVFFDALGRVADASPNAGILGYLAFFGLLGLGGLAGQALHVLHWFGPGHDQSDRPRIYGIYPHARLGVLAMLALELVPPLGCLYLLVYFLRLGPP